MSRKKIPLAQKTCTNWNGRYPRALETDTFVFFVKFDEGDENAQTIMYRKMPDHLELVSDNYFASEGIQDELREGNETWMSPAMNKERKFYVEELILPLVKEYIELSHKGELGEKFNDLEQELDEYYVALPEENACLFLEHKFSDYL